MKSLDLEDRWMLLCGHVGLDGGELWKELLAAYTCPARAYHNLNHIADCLVLFDEHRHLATNPVCLEFAIWFHDVVYDTRAADNEVRSATAAAEFLAAASDVGDVSGLILATRHDGSPGSGDADLLCDIDLSILGRAPDAYDKYAVSIRREYSWVPLEDYVKGRRRVLEFFLSRRSIYALDAFEKAYGMQARENIRREIASLARGGLE